MEIDLYDLLLVVKQKITRHRICLILCIEFLWVLSYSVLLYSRGTVDVLYLENEIYADTQEEFLTNKINVEETGMDIGLRTRGDTTLKKGIYDITIGFQSTHGGSAEVFGYTKNTQSMWNETITLAASGDETHFQVWVNEEFDGFNVSVKASEGQMTVEYIHIKTAKNSQLYLLLCLIVKITIGNLIIFGVMFRGKLRKYSVPICGIFGIGFLCSLGLFTRYLTFAYDMVFHMNRIEGLKDGILSGMLPVRIQPTWNSGWGYAVSSMYGDITLVLPALMRICGFTLQTTWKTFIVVVNFLTAGISFYVFYEITKDKYKALFTALLYCLMPYRLACIYVRAAVGEFTVMLFLPLAVLGFWYAFGEKADQERYGKKLLAPVIGFTGMIQTHILTCEMSLLFIIFLCIIMIKEVMRRETLIYLFKIAIFTILINLWFVVPFIRFSKEDLSVFQIEEMRDDFRTWGLSVAELFAPTASHANGFTFGENVSLASKCTFSLGLAWLGMTAVILLFLWNRKVEKEKAAFISLIFGGIAAFMATNLFPYHLMKEHMVFLSKILAKIQFPFRFLGMAGLFFAFALCFFLLGIQNVMKERYLSLVLTAIAVLTIYQGTDYQYQILYGGSCINIYSSAVLDTTNVVSGEYLYQGSRVDITSERQKVTGSGVQIQSVKRKYLNTSIQCTAQQSGAYLELPIFYYPGYEAVDAKGNSYQVSRSENNNCIRVKLPEEFDGNINVSYKEPLYFRLCELVSFIAFIILIGDWIWKKRKEDLI